MDMHILDDFSLPFTKKTNQFQNRTDCCSIQLSHTHEKQLNSSQIDDVCLFVIKLLLVFTAEFRS